EGTGAGGAVADQSHRQHSDDRSLQGVEGERRFRKQATMRNRPDWNLAGGSRPYERARCPFARHLPVETIAESIGTRHPWTVLLIGSTLARRLQTSVRG